MKTRRHHNNKGTRQIKRGMCQVRTKRLAKQLGIPYGNQKSIDQISNNETKNT